jgi:hypothetical protein
MSLATCVGCGLPVLELRGQFTLLDSYLIEGGHPPEADVGHWHISCLQAAGVGARWAQVLVQNYTSVRGYRVLGETAAGCVIENPRTGEVLAIDQHGTGSSLMFQAAPHRLVPGGGAYQLREVEYGLDVGNVTWSQEIQTALRAQGSYSILDLARGLGIEAKLSHPELLADAAFRYDEELEEEWGPMFVLAPVEYQVFVPGEWFPYVRIKPRP